MTSSNERSAGSVSYGTDAGSADAAEVELQPVELCQLGETALDGIGFRPTTVGCREELHFDSGDDIVLHDDFPRPTASESAYSYEPGERREQVLEDESHQHGVPLVWERDETTLPGVGSGACGEGEGQWQSQIPDLSYVDQRSRAKWFMLAKRQLSRLHDGFRLDTDVPPDGQFLPSEEHQEGLAGGIGVDAGVARVGSALELLSERIEETFGPLPHEATSGEVPLEDCCGSATSTATATEEIERYRELEVPEYQGDPARWLDGLVARNNNNPDVADLVEVCESLAAEIHAVGFKSAEYDAAQGPDFRAMAADVRTFLRRSGIDLPMAETNRGGHG